MPRSSSQSVHVHTSVLFTLLLLQCLLLLVNAIGFPTGGGGSGGCCCCGGGGGGGGCVPACGGGGGGYGRKKREAVLPHFKGAEVPCPQTEWRELMNEAIVSGDAIASLGSIQSQMHARFGDNHKFLVNCAGAEKIDKEDKESGGNALAGSASHASAESIHRLPLSIEFSSSGDGYCNVYREGIWCQAIALYA